VSNAYITAVLNSDVTSQSQFAVLLVLADKANDKGQCWLHVETLAALSRSARSTALQALAALKEAGYITSQRRRGLPSVYTLSMKRLTAQKSSSQTVQDLDGPDPGPSSSQTSEVQDLDRSKENPQRTLKRPKSTIEEHPDARKLCDRLVELVVANGSKKPTISNAWLDAGRLLLTADGRTFEDAMAVLEWSQASVFWRANVRSMPKFRDQYDQLRLQAEGRGELKKTAPRLDSAAAVREWLKDEWRAGRTSEIQKRSGLRYEPPDVPPDVRGVDAQARFHADRARDWITEHLDEIVTRMTREANAA
jgi:hypothetical protein